MVIFLFLRSFWATVIPAVTVPLSLLGACSLMWAFGYTLDNLSLMALTIAVGFVVDDAIVMLENITRYIEQGERPLAAAFRGASEIGFTIVSISVSLVAVLIPLLLMGGIIGRLFREFAVTLAMAIFVSMAVSLTLTPMMASRFMRAHNEVKPGEKRDVNAQEIIARLRPKLEEVESARLYMQASQDVRMGGRATRTQFEYTLQDAILAELNEWAPKILARMRELPQLRDVA